MRNGTLHKMEQGWVVRWSDIHQFGFGWHMMDTPLHPDDESEFMGTIQQIIDWDGMKVEFEIITTGYDKETYVPIDYAKLSKNYL